MYPPLRFLPFLRPMVWGGRRLGEVLGQPLPSDEPFGESWVISDHPIHRSITATGPWAGRSLRELMEQERAALLGPAASAHAVFPWLVKFLDANDWLSVQVHPDEEAVKRLWPGEGGKTEAWLVLDAAPGSRVYAGLLPGIDEQRLRAALQAGTVAECLHQFEPQPGDCIFLSAGTVHAVGGGVLIAEVQQTSDATFRLFDWNRRDAQGRMRPLHIEQALACIDWSRGPVTPIRVEGFGSGAARRQPLVRSPYFDLAYVAENQPIPWGGEGRLQAVVVLRGRGRLETAWGEEIVAAGQAWVLPAAMTPVKCWPEPSLSLLVCTLP
ncbi:MAG TPA: type I phosphomannose isomerase catalytic subunit [Gemmataceae bacterium]|nr:type I phosphomannose isomerase catalytic subunit [Gemmataceae bacterium]